jgi:hypothetical protein
LFPTVTIFIKSLNYVLQVPAVGFQEGGSSFRRKLSKREKKQLKKQEKLNKLKTNAPTNNENDGGVAGKLYTGTCLFPTSKLSSDRMLGSYSSVISHYLLPASVYEDCHTLSYNMPFLRVESCSYSCS